MTNEGLGREEGVEGRGGCLRYDQALRKMYIATRLCKRELLLHSIISELELRLYRDRSLLLPITLPFIAFSLMLVRIIKISQVDIH